jgi:hypothetical protein
MARVELPESRLKIRKRRRRMRISLVLGSFFVLLLALVVGLSRIPALQIQAVMVSGAQTISSTTIAHFVDERLEGNYLGLFPKRNIFLYPKGALAKAIMAAYPSIASADVHANDFESIAVLVVERAPRALWCPSASAAGCYFMDEHGVVYEGAPTFSEPVYTRYVSTRQGVLPWQFLSPEQFQALSALVDAIAQKLQDEQITYVVVDHEEDVRIKFASGFSLIFALKDPGGDIFERFSLALTSETVSKHKLSDFEYLDLRFGDKLYYKLR